MICTVVTCIVGVGFTSPMPMPTRVGAQQVRPGKATHLQHYTASDLGTLNSGTFSEPFHMISEGGFVLQSGPSPTVFSNMLCVITLRGYLAPA